MNVLLAWENTVSKVFILHYSKNQFTCLRYDPCFAVASSVNGKTSKKSMANRVVSPACFSL